jgi:hypothetical protein
MFARKEYTTKKGYVNSYVLRVCDMCRDSDHYGEKYCSKCGGLKPLDQYFQRKDAPNQKYQAACKSCVSVYGKEYRAKKLYGITYDEIQSIKAEQEDSCTICGEITQLVVDHNHTTGQVRALLCDLCNRGLGYFRDNPELLMRASNYLLEKGYAG